jgi:hypothetical protein
MVRTPKELLLLTSGPSMDSDEIVLKFVEAVRAQGGTIYTRTSPSPVGEIERRLSFPLPHFYRRLIAGYEYFPFTIGNLVFFGAFGEKSDPDDIACKLFLDPAFVSTLLPARLFHFARPDTGSYDPVCVDLSTPGTIDGPVVTIDHETILCESKVRVVTQVARSLQRFMEEAGGR